MANVLEWSDIANCIVRLRNKYQCAVDTHYSLNDQVDSTNNYAFTKALVDWITTDSRLLQSARGRSVDRTGD